MPAVTNCMRAVLYSAISASTLLQVKSVCHIARSVAGTRIIQLYSTKRTLSYVSSACLQSSLCTKNRVVLPQKCFRTSAYIGYSSKHDVASSKVNSGASPINTRPITSRTSTRNPESDWDHTERHIHVGGSGDVKLDIYNLSQPDQLGTGTSSESFDVEQSLSTSRSNNILIYLPPGPSPTGVDGPDKCFENILAMSADLTHPCVPTVIKVNYRLRPWSDRNNEVDDFRFPIAVHDTATCFEWILEHLDSLVLSHRSQRSTNDDDRELDTDDIQISICGSHIGGSLALTTALTNPNDINCVAVIDPVVDWAGLDELVAAADASDGPDTGDTSQTRRKRRTRSTVDIMSSPYLDPEQAAARAMIDLRTSLFHNPSAFFDPFASPILFLRAPGKDTPLWRNARPEVELQHLKEETMTGFGPYDDDWHTVNDGYKEVLINDAGMQDDAYLDNLTEAVGANAISALNSDPILHSSKLPDLQAENTPPISIVQVATDLSDMSMSTANPSAYDVGELDRESSSQSITNLSNLNRDLSISSSDETLDDQDTKTPKRRKVLRRWPPVAQPEEVLLPNVRIFSTLPSSSRTNRSNGDNNTEKIDLAHVLHPQAKEMVDVMRRACFWGREKSLAEERVTIEILNDRKGLVDDQVENTEVDQVCTWLSSNVNEDRVR